jgi:phosphoglycolate phosphatase-like HAD superfamily hydrolase
LNEDNRYKWNKATVTTILTRQEYCGDVVNFKTTKHFRDKRNYYVAKSEWHITESVHEPIIDRVTFENVQRILENAPVKRPNLNGDIHPLSGLLFCKDCGSKMHVRISWTGGERDGRRMAFCSEYAKGKARNPKCATPHRIDADVLLQNIAEVLSKIAKYSLDNKDTFEGMVKDSLALRQTDEVKKQQKRIPQITARLEQIDKVINKLYEDYALSAIDQDRYQQLSQKYSEEYYTLKAELEQAKTHLSDHENTSGRAKQFIKLVDKYSAFDEITATAINEFISKLVVHERDVKGARHAVQHVEVHFNYIGKFENELTERVSPTEQEQRRLREEIDNTKLETRRAYHRAYYKEYRQKNLEKQREYDRMKAKEYREKKKIMKAREADGQGETNPNIEKCVS